jgi:hypothetical protein
MLNILLAAKIDGRWQRVAILRVGEMRGSYTSRAHPWNTRGRGSEDRDQYIPRGARKSSWR